MSRSLSPIQRAILEQLPSSPTVEMLVTALGELDDTATRAALRSLKRRGLVREPWTRPRGFWVLTDQGWDIVRPPAA